MDEDMRFYSTKQNNYKLSFFLLLLDIYMFV